MVGFQILTELNVFNYYNAVKGLRVLDSKHFCVGLVREHLLNAKQKPLKQHSGDPNDEHLHYRSIQIMDSTI